MEQLETIRSYWNTRADGYSKSVMEEMEDEYYGAAEPPVRCGESHLSGLTEPPHFVY